LIAIEGKTQVAAPAGETEPKGLDSLSIGGDRNEMALFEVQVADLDALFVWPKNQSAFVDSYG